MRFIFSNGGIVVYLLSFISIVSLSVVLEKIYYYVKNEKKSSVHELTSLIEFQMKNKKNSEIAVENELREFFINKTLKLENKLWVLAIAGSLSPLLGLLGTVGGMIKAFGTIALVGTGDPKLLAEGISEALITTAAGICVALPTSAFYSYFCKKNQKIILTLEKVSIETINKIKSDN